ncbi:hypothetical protein IVB36_01440 [Bradyrhizobium sp. 35]|uniref:hypothetical protein n=1 Tax=Bradyrhizobium sp. 35 TaxID=2782670 RepID=UPI001FF8C931|nr:hypothetical protein [Bradyrhizobium sp. 35]MCK1449610.1 hypothetical protein [Bradyrhizobium sp. 35]
MNGIKTIARLMFPSEKTLFRLYRKYIPSPEPRWLAPALYGANFALLLIVWVLILTGD